MATTTTNPTLSAFEESLAALDVELTRTTVDDFAATLDDIVRDPAVGVPLPFDVDYPDSVTVDPTPAAVERATTGVTPASYGIANYGSVVLPSTDSGAELVSLYPELHVPVVHADDILPDLPSALDRFGDAARDDDLSAIVATGPSATADMGDLVLGAHGPKAVHVVMLDE
ncbi:L-lactate dehydrogenase complex protein LldG [Haloplanus vescus]|uniref:L-lactate dehydrogenase complex protein LldG n=1 Tax=Haloplanus vescus TaxID=555874 RepID=A0A1H3Y9D8_9EURY|nr:LUD domain-containing protein [Haloplanus vescus]SEA07621.1 L-lactate dehydrogenase complex protein LldG [Haloplanus vescus]